VPRLDPLKVTIHEFDAGFDVAGAKIVDGFPSVGLVSTIAANYLIDALKLRQIGVMDNVNFPTLSVVHNSEPLSPVRIYGGEIAPAGDRGRREKIVVFVSEFQPAPALTRPIAESILEWARMRKCGFIISPEGLVLEGEGGDGEDKVEVYGIGSTAPANSLLRERGVAPFKEGIITGVSGVLLNLGKREKYDVLSILAEAHPNYPDARSAAVVIESIAKLLGLHINVEPLIREAEGFEQQIKRLQQKAASREHRAEAQTQMYG
jgi:uncharacterized protein